MADLSKTVAIIFNAVDNTGGALTGIGGAIDSFASGAQTAIAPINNLADAVKIADSAIVAFGIAIGVKALEASGKFSTQINEIGTLFGATGDQLDQFSGDILNYASGSTQSIDKINAAIYSAVSSGVDYKDSLDFLTEAEKLSVAGKADLEATTKVLTGTMNAYGATVDETGQYSDYLMKTVQLGQTTLPELANSLSQVTSTAAAAGIGFDEVAAAIAGLTASGVPTDQAMTAIKGAISNILKPTADAEEAAKALGIQFDVAALQSKGLSGVFQDVYEKTGGNVEQMAKLFGSMEGLKAATALGADNSGIYAKALEGMANSAGTTAEAFKLMEGNFDLMQQRLANGVQTLLISVGKPLQDDFGGIVSELQGILKGATFAINDGAFDEVFTAIGNVSGKLTDWLKQLAANLPAALDQVDFGKFAASLENLADSVGGIFDGIDVSTPEGLADAIQTVVDVIANLINQGAGIVQTWDAWLEKAKPLVDAFAGMSQETATAQGELLGLGDVLNVLLPAIGAVGEGIEAIGTAFEAVATIKVAKFITGASTAKEALAAIQTASAGALTALAGGAALTGGLVAGAGAAGYAVGSVLGAGIDWVVGKLTGGQSLGIAIYDLVNGSNEVASAAPKAASGVKQIGDAASAASPATKDLIDRADELIDGLKGFGEAVPVTKSLEDMAWAAGEAATKADFLAKAQAALKTPTLENKQAMAEAATAYKDTAISAGNAAEASKLIREQYEKLNPSASQINEKLTTSKGVMEELASKTDLTNKELIELAKVTADAEYKLAQLASNEKIKQIESKVKLDIAEVEANTKIATSLIDSINKSYQADVGLIGDLMKTVTDGYSLADQTKIKLAEAANERVTELHEKQMALVDAQVNYMTAKTSAIANGNPLVSIQADGLQPHLESFMWEILKAIQVKMAYDGGDMLVGGCSL